MAVVVICLILLVCCLYVVYVLIVLVYLFNLCCGCFVWLLICFVVVLYLVCWLAISCVVLIVWFGCGLFRFVLMFSIASSGLGVICVCCVGYAVMIVSGGCVAGICVFSVAFVGGVCALCGFFGLFLCGGLMDVDLLCWLFVVVSF